MSVIDIFAIEGYADAVSKEQALRDAAFLELPEWIGGVSVKPLTLQLCNRLAAFRSPFFGGVPGQYSAVDVGNFLWTVSPEWRPIKTRLNRKGQVVAYGWNIWRKWLFLRKHRRSIATEMKRDDGSTALLPCAKTVLEIQEYVNEAFYDAYNGGGSAPRRKRYTSWNADLVHDFKRGYNWEPERTQTTALRILFQLRKSIRRDLDPKAALYNHSDSILENHFIRLNERGVSSAAESGCGSPPGPN